MNHKAITNRVVNIMKKSVLFFIILTEISALSSCNWWINDRGELMEYKNILFINDSQECIMVAGWYDENPNSIIDMKLVFGPPPNLIEKINIHEIYKRNVIPMSMEDKYYYSFIILKQKTMDKYSKEELIEKEIYDYRYVFSYTDLEEMEFKVHFTGGDELDKFRID